MSSNVFSGRKKIVLIDGFKYLQFPCFHKTMWMQSTGTIWTASSEFGTYRLCEQRWFRRACASAQSRQNLSCSLIQAVCQEEPSDRKPDPWPLWMAGHAQLKFVMTEFSKTQIRLTGPIWKVMATVVFLKAKNKTPYNFHISVKVYIILFSQMTILSTYFSTSVQSYRPL